MISHQCILLCRAVFFCFRLTEMFTLAGHNVSDENESANSEGMLTDLADKVSNMEAEMHALEEEYQKDLLEHKQVFLPSNPQNLCYYRCI